MSGYSIQDGTSFSPSHRDGVKKVLLEYCPYAPLEQLNYRRWMQNASQRFANCSMTMVVPLFVSSSVS